RLIGGEPRQVLADDDRTGIPAIRLALIDHVAAAREAHFELDAVDVVDIRVPRQADSRLGTAEITEDHHGRSCPIDDGLRRGPTDHGRSGDDGTLVDGGQPAIVGWIYLSQVEADIEIGEILHRVYAEELRDIAVARRRPGREIVRLE